MDLESELFNGKPEHLLERLSEISKIQGAPDGPPTLYITSQATGDDIWRAWLQRFYTPAELKALSPEACSRVILVRVPDYIKHEGATDGVIELVELPDGWRMRTRATPHSWPALKLGYDWLNRYLRQHGWLAKLGKARKPHGSTEASLAEMLAARERNRDRMTGKVTLGFYKACDQVAIKADTIRVNYPDLARRWKDPTYTPRLSDFVTDL